MKTINILFCLLLISFTLTYSQVGELPLLRKFPPFSRNIQSITLSNSGKYIAASLVGSFNSINDTLIHDLFLINTKGSEDEIKNLMGHKGWVYSVKFSGDSKILASAGADKSVRIYNSESGEFINSLTDFNTMIQALSVNKNGTLVAVGGQSLLKIFSVKEGDLVNEIKPIQGKIASLSFSPDGSLLAYAENSPLNGGNYIIQVYRLSDMRRIVKFQGHSKDITSLGFSKDGKLLASVSYDGTLRIWRVSDGYTVKVIPVEDLYLQSVAFGPDSKSVACGGLNSKIYIYSLTDFNMVTTISVQGSVRELSFSDSTNVMLAGNGNEALLYDFSPVIYYREIADRYPELFKPKGEFETPMEYKNRKSEADELRDIYLKKRTGEDQAKRKKEEIDNRANLERIKKDSRKEVTLSIQSVGIYDLEKEQIPITILGKTERVTIPFAEAKSFKENYRNAKVKATKQLKDNLKTFEYVDIKIIHPITYSKYDFNSKISE